MGYKAACVLLVSAAALFAALLIGSKAVVAYNEQLDRNAEEAKTLAGKESLRQTREEAARLNRQKPETEDRQGSRPETPRRKASLGTQAKRENLIESLIDDKIFSKVVYGPNLSVWVLPKFYSLTFDLKQNYLAVVVGYQLEIEVGESMRDGEGLRIIDALNGREVGCLTSSELILR